MLSRALLPYAAAVALAGLAVWRVYAWGYDTADAEWSARHAEATLAAERSARLELSEREKRRGALARALGEANAELEIMRGKLAAGTGRVFVRANCPAVPAAPADAGGTGGRAVELDPATRQDYLVLRAAMTAQFEALQFCRAELRARSQ